MIDLLCVDAAAQEDLMMLDQLARAVAQRQAAGVGQMVLQGSGETHERKLETAGHGIARKDGALTCTDPLLELVFRETNRSWSNRLTDEGLHALALLGSDRGFLRLEAGEVVISKRLEASAWPAEAVIPVLGTLARDAGGCLQDVHPIRVACALAATRPGVFRIVLLTRRALPKSVADQPLSGAQIQEKGWLEPKTPIPPAGTAWALADPSGWAAGSCVEVL
jgi:hypothetical protein